MALLLYIPYLIFVLYTWFDGVITNFHENVGLGLVAMFLPAYGFVTGLLHLFTPDHMNIAHQIIQSFHG